MKFQRLRRFDFVRDGLTLAAYDSGGDGLPVVFQHGLCGDAHQTAEAFPDDPRFRLITLECRGHGASQAGSAFSIATFAEDVAALIDHLALAPVVLGGISMGAAIASRLAVHRPDLVRGLILARPAWVDRSGARQYAAQLEVGELLAEIVLLSAGTATRREQLARLRAQATSSKVPPTSGWRAEAPDNLASLLGFFEREPIAVTSALLRSISADGPGITEADLMSLSLPALVLATEKDAIHPLGAGRTAGATHSGCASGEDDAERRRQAGLSCRFPCGAQHVSEGFLTMPSPTWLADLPRDRLIGEFSMWSADLIRLADDLERIEGHADILHVDVADGHFAPALLFFPDQVARMRQASRLPIHVHLMVADAVLLSQVDQFADAGADLISVHAENANAGEALALIADRGIASGIVLRVETPVAAVRPFLDRVDFLTLLGTAIGVKGQASIPPPLTGCGKPEAMSRSSAGVSCWLRMAASAKTRCRCCARQERRRS